MNKVILKFCADRVIPEKADIPAALLHNYNLETIMGDSVMKRIKLTQNQFALVDDIDFPELNKLKWYAMKTSYGGYMAVRAVKRKKILMHRVVMDCPQGLDVDHISHSTLNNRKSNLRICSRSQNSMNSNPRKNTSSQYKGCCWYKRKRKWIAYIILNRKQIHLGYFDSEIEAARAYDKAAVEHFGEFALFNFPLKR